MPAATDLWWASDGAGSPMLLLHSGLSDSRSWEPVLPALAGRHRIVRYDARGFGRSPDPTSEFDAIADARGVMDAAGIREAHLVGNSMGALVARAIAVLHPDRVRSLILVGPSFPITDAPESAVHLARQWQQARESWDVGAALSAARTLWIAGEAQEQRLRELLTRQRPDLPDAAPFPDAVQEVERIAVPTMVLVGERDSPLVIRGSEALARRIPGARLEAISGARHHPHEDDPNGFLRLITEFVAGVDAGPPGTGLRLREP